jgi:HD-GYP domain-containing protein (c-di-GMP phosphodiesterase class II)
MAQVLKFPVVKNETDDARDKIGDLYPLPLRLFKSGETLPCTIYLKSPAESDVRKIALFDQASSQLVLPPLGDEGAWGYFDLAEAGPLLGHLSGRLEEMGASDGASVAEKAQFFYDTALVWIQHFFHGAPETFAPDQLHLAEDLIAGWYGLIQGAERPREVILTVRRHDSGLFTHSVNVCMWGLAFVRYLNWPEHAAAVFGLGALLHDIGMTSLPRPIWTKTEPLTNEEQEAIKTHPQLGVHLLENFPDLPGTIFFMVAQHHESDDGSGYPLGLPERAIHPWARLLRLLDTYEAMTSIRPWRAPLSSPKALKILRHTAGPTTLTPALLASFEEFCGESGNGT